MPPRSWTLFGGIFMDKRVKFTLKQRLWAVRSVTKGLESCRSMSKKLQCSKSTVQQWLAHYRDHGAMGLSLRNGSYEGSFKVRVIEYMLKNGLSLMQTAAFFSIPNIYVVSRWRQLYERQGASALLKETRGRKKTLMPKKQKSTKKASSGTESSAEHLAALQKEVEYLRAENAFLKKLEALVQQEEAAKAQSKQQKPSRN